MAGQDWLYPRADWLHPCADLLYLPADWPYPRADWLHLQDHEASPHGDAASPAQSCSQSRRRIRPLQLILLYIFFTVIFCYHGE